MKTTMKIVLTSIAVFLLGIGYSFAHAIWIETPATGRQGVAQEIKIYFGEFGTEDISKTNDWFSDLNQFELQLTDPDGQTRLLTLKANGDHFAASFIPEADGLYNLVLHKTASEVSYGYKLEYMASAHVQVGRERAFSAQGQPIALQPLAERYQTGEAVNLSILIDSTLSGEKEIKVISPNTWVKQLYPNEKSQASFVPLWPGKYLVETTVTEKRANQWKGKDYTVHYRCHTYLLEVK